jgi:hypothetical protein
MQDPTMSTFKRETEDAADRGGTLDSPRSKPTTVMCVGSKRKRKTEEEEEEEENSSSQVNILKA